MCGDRRSGVEGLHGRFSIERVRKALSDTLNAHFIAEKDSTWKVVKKILIELLLY